MPVALNRDDGVYEAYTIPFRRPKNAPPPPPTFDDHSDEDIPFPKFPNAPKFPTIPHSQPEPNFPDIPRSSNFPDVPRSSFEALDVPLPQIRSDSNERFPIQIRSSNPPPPNMHYPNNTGVIRKGMGLKINPPRKQPRYEAIDDPEIQARIHRLQDLDRRILVHTEGLHELEEIVKQRSGDLNTIQAEYEYVQSLLEELREKESQQNNEIAILKQQHKGANEKYMDILRQCESLQHDFNNLDNSFREKKRKLEIQYDRFATSMNHKKRELERELRELESKRDFKEKETAKQIKQYEQKSHGKREMMETLETQKLGLQDDIEHSTQQLTDLAEEITERREVLNLAQRQIEPKLEKLARVREQAMREEKRVKDLVNFFMETEKKLSFAETQVESVVKYQEEIVKMETYKQQLLRQCDDLEEKAAHQRKRLDELVHAVDDKHEDRHQKALSKAYAKNYYDQEIEKVAMNIERDFDALKLKELTQKEEEIRNRLKLRDDINPT